MERAIPAGMCTESGVSVQELGEFGLIDRLRRVFETNYSRRGERDDPFRLLVGNGDDAAAWDGPAGTTVLTCDAMAAGTHFDLAYSKPEDVGWRAMVSCQSDIAAMGYVPAYSTVTVGLTGQEDAETVDHLYVGMAQACSRYGGRIVGGDVVRAVGLFLSVAMIGADPSAPTGRPTRPMTRSAARAGDVIAVAGPVGGSAGGLKILKEGVDARGPDAEALVREHLRPRPRVWTAIRLAAAGVRCAVDISDGLLADLMRVCGSSGKSAVVRIADLPVQPELKAVFPDDWRELALSGGEGYQLLFTARKELVDSSREVDPDVVAIGEVLDGQGEVSVVAEDGSRIEGRSGFDHFGP